MQKLTRTAAMTDIHFGAKSGSEVHNKDCIRYLEWFCEQAILHKADNVIFLGDWFENRSAINISTLTYSYQGAKMLNDLGIPVFIITGNHDLYHRHTREIYSTIHFHEFSNFTVITSPVRIPNILTEPLLCPYMFHNEYPSLIQYNNVPTWWGHFEFKGFIVTGYNITMTTGPDHTLFTGPEYIFSGHFHKRQRSGNVVYIGNTFPTNFSDADDINRGMMIYDHETQKIKFLDWPDCPRYVKTSLSSIIDGDIKLLPESRVKCLVDIPLSFEESQNLKHQLIDTHNLREMVIEEVNDLAVVLSETEIEGELADFDELDSIDDLIIQMLTSINTDHIKNDLLIELYRKLG